MITTNFSEVKCNQYIIDENNKIISPLECTLTIKSTGNVKVYYYILNGAMYNVNNCNEFEIKGFFNDKCKIVYSSDDKTQEIVLILKSNDSITLPLNYCTFDIHSDIEYEDVSINYLSIVDNDFFTISDNSLIISLPYIEDISFDSNVMTVVGGYSENSNNITLTINFTSTVFKKGWYIGFFDNYSYSDQKIQADFNKQSFDIKANGTVCQSSVIGCKITGRTCSSDREIGLTLDGLYWELNQIKELTSINIVFSGDTNQYITLSKIEGEDFNDFVWTDNIKIVDVGEIQIVHACNILYTLNKYLEQGVTGWATISYSYQEEQKELWKINDFSKESEKINKPSAYSIVDRDFCSTPPPWENIAATRQIQIEINNTETDSVSYKSDCTLTINRITPTIKFNSMIFNQFDFTYEVPNGTLKDFLTDYNRTNYDIDSLDENTNTITIPYAGNTYNVSTSINHSSEKEDKIYEFLTKEKKNDYSSPLGLKCYTKALSILQNSEPSEFECWYALWEEQNNLKELSRFLKLKEIKRKDNTATFVFDINLTSHFGEVTGSSEGVNDYYDGIGTSSTWAFNKTYHKNNNESSEGDALGSLNTSLEYPVILGFIYNGGYYAIKQENSISISGDNVRTSYSRGVGSLPLVLQGGRKLGLKLIRNSENDVWGRNDGFDGTYTIFVYPCAFSIKKLGDIK